MQLTKYTDISLRVLMFLALKNSELSTISEISKKFNISKNHLMKVVNKLVALGYVKSLQGRGGGVSLACPATDITVGMIVREMETTFDLIDCDTVPCPINSICKLKHAVNKATDSFLAILDNYTIADLVTPQRPLLNLLG